MVAIKATALLSLLAVVSAAPLEARQREPDFTQKNDYTTLMTLDAVKPVPNSAVPWNDGSINANHNKFYIGQKSLVECVPNQPCDKTPSKAGFLLYHTQNILSLNVDVLGKQQVYIDDKGALSYLIPRDPLPTLRTKADDWHLVDRADYVFYNQQVNIWWACPPTAATKTTGPWQIFADTRQVIVKDSDVPSGKKADCTIFNLKPNFYNPLWYNNGN
ncbi:hypothetical protein H072_4627 [Dactylellina haptotyla CBS 200.50]|uniref:Uncharacterized protein n=1 Tax=Dactylellina haptotyla (strain CBS 200.50) TaxID=1284197 RepID=S8BPV7_DACHA|nr:hypothetical protein H072_4627 [Dactylellina haptotyla CBS 200.50]